MKTAFASDETAIQDLEHRFVIAFNAGDIDAIMKNYIEDETLFVFDVVPREQHYGADSYRRAWADLFSHFEGIPKITITDLNITVGGDIGFSHSIQQVAGVDKWGHTIKRTVRVTDGYRKVGNNWLIALEHVSLPVDLATGKASEGSDT
jgi:ketosteroid isomerase-like protein